MKILPVSNCFRCQSRPAVNAAVPVCQACWGVVCQRFREKQERDYLAAWLSARVDAAGNPVDDSALTVYASDRREIARCVMLARCFGVDWTQPLAPRSLAEASENGAGQPPKKRGRPRRQENVYVFPHSPDFNLAAS